MQLCGLQVKGPSDFPTLDAVSTFAKLANYASAVGSLVSGLLAHWLGFLAHFDELIGQWHGPTEQFTHSARAAN
jgi:hypothetical protein